MIGKHIAEFLIESNKKLLSIIDKIHHENSPYTQPQNAIDDINDIIRQLDHIVEKSGKSSS
jgi:hypothetical protein